MRVSALGRERARPKYKVEGLASAEKYLAGSSSRECRVFPLWAVTLPHAYLAFKLKGINVLLCCALVVLLFSARHISLRARARSFATLTPRPRGSTTFARARRDAAADRAQRRLYTVSTTSSAPFTCAFPVIR
jgi:hypothetical protein